jgi:hypothetical protein
VPGCDGKAGSVKEENYIFTTESTSCTQVPVARLASLRQEAKTVSSRAWKTTTFKVNSRGGKVMGLLATFAVLKGMPLIYEKNIIHPSYNQDMPTVPAKVLTT